MGLSFCLSNGFSGDADASGLGPHFEEQDLVDKAHGQEQQAGTLPTSGQGWEHYC